MNTPSRILGLTSLIFLATAASVAAQQSQADITAALHWRSIGPTRAGRGRAAAGVPGSATRPTALYVGFDNGGLWRSTDYGANWVPLFDNQPTSSVGAIGIAASNPDVIYVGTGGGIIRPDLSTGDGVYKSVDAGRTWTRLGLQATQMIAQVDVDPTNPDRLFVAALGHPYGPNAERGIFRSTDGGRSFEKVLYTDEYTSANDVRIDPRDPNTVYAALWPQQEAYFEGGGFTSGAGGIFKSTDGGTTWTQLSEGLPSVLEANLAIAPSNPQVIYAMLAVINPGATGASSLALYRSTDGGAHWAVRTRSTGRPGDPGTLDRRPLGRIGGGDLPTIVVDPRDENVVYSTSTVLWRSDDAGTSWTAVRGAPGGDDYQRVWVDPADPNVLLVNSDQGATVSANHGASFSSWYTQSTAAVYHTTTDNAYPYRVCSGQQDSGSLCIASRSDDGEITFHDWHPVNIQEYGMAAPDPRDPDIVFGSGRTNVSRYDRGTGQTTQVGPDAAARGTDWGRNVRTMPLVWSPARPDVLLYASNAVWRSLDRGHTWTRISPDLARATWTPPTSAGRYAGNITPGPRGAITALAPSPRSAQTIWAGTDDGVIQVTTNGGRTWSNVTPPVIQPWTRIFNMDAGHFDALTAYAAANTLRIDDMRPHFFKTHDGGQSWTEISAGIDSGAVANSIREDPRQPGLLYAATETQVWVSTDDGATWQSLRLNMPAVSVRDLEVKNDSLCGCADLIAGTHGRGFWILDDLTPLRQAAQLREAQAGGKPFLVRPLIATRVRFGTNDPTPWPPELAAGENPPEGAVLDYFLPADAAGRVTLEIVDAAGHVVRHYASDDPVLDPDPSHDQAAYDRICRRTPTATDCGLPLYWPGPESRLASRAGMHRFLWDMRYQPLTATNPDEAGDVGAVGAVPGRSSHAPSAPWAAPGSYTVRLTANGPPLTQPLRLRLDPRVKTPSLALGQLTALTKEMYDRAASVRAAYDSARALRASVATPSQAQAGLVAQLDSLAPAPRQRGGGGGGGGGFGRPGAGGAAAPPTLDGASNALLAAAMAMQNADITPTTAQVAACGRARTQALEVMAKWARLRTALGRP
jgi:photosystem II stability/assembly factor-like uncharacterized protein